MAICLCGLFVANFCDSVLHLFKQLKVILYSVSHNLGIKVFVSEEVKSVVC